MKDKRNEIFSANLRAERSRKNFTQERLAELSKVSIASISLIERGKQSPSIFTVIDIAKALNIDINELLKDV